MNPLRALGVNETEERLYRQVLRSPGLDPGILAAELGLDLSAITEATAGLRRLGLAITTGESERIYPTPPAMALHLLQLRIRQSLLQREEELDVAQLEAQRLIEAFEGEKPPDPSVEIVETIQGRELIAQHFEMLQRATKHEVLGFDRPPYATTSAGNPTEKEMLDRGVAYRVIYDPSALEMPYQPADLLRCIADGEEARILDGIPLKTMIFDRRIALVPLNLSQPMLAESLVIHESALLDALILLFETLWKAAVPFTSEPSEAAPELPEFDQHLLTLMSAGLSDQRLARQLDISPRTLARRITRVIELLEAHSRFQAGVIAARRGWV